MEKEKNIVSATVVFDQDSKTFHRFRIESDYGIVGTVYFPKGKQIPDKLILKVRTKKTE